RQGRGHDKSRNRSSGHQKLPSLQRNATVTDTSRSNPVLSGHDQEHRSSTAPLGTSRLAAPLDALVRHALETHWKSRPSLAWVGVWPSLAWLGARDRRETT